MKRTIGLMMAERIAVGIVEDNAIVGATRIFPEDENESDFFDGVPAEEIARHIAREIMHVVRDASIEAVGVGYSGIIRDGVVEDSPNLKQTKGQNLARDLTDLLRQADMSASVHVLNDADATAAGVAATHGQLDKLIRVWTLGNGIGFGRYPQADGFWEGGHTIVSLDPKERFCGCGGIGHLEGIMGYRAMRLRFLDLEPEEMFACAATGDERCRAFVELWHRALAAATATSIHMDGAGKFFISGPNAKFIQIGMLDEYLHEMVKMSPLQGSALEVISTSDETAIIGAAVSAEHATTGRG